MNQKRFAKEYPSLNLEVLTQFILSLYLRSGNHGEFILLSCGSLTDLKPISGDWGTLSHNGLQQRISYTEAFGTSNCQ